MIKKILIISCILGFAGYHIAGATSGACSSHGGVNCSAIGVYATCNDWTQSSVFYTDVVECKNSVSCYYPIAAGCVSQDQYNLLLNQEAQATNVSNWRGFGYSADEINQKVAEISQEYDQKLSQCQTQIQGYELQKTAYQECLNNQLKQSAQLFNPTPLVAPQATSQNSSSIEAYVNAEMQKECVGRDPNSFYDTQRPIKGCSCNAGYIMNHSNQCILVTPTSTTTISAPLPATTPSTPPAIQGFTITASLSLGSSGSNVVSLQKLLEGHGFLVMPSGVFEGYFGGLTKQALVAFQASIGLPATGNCGPMTRSAINGQ